MFDKIIEHLFLSDASSLLCDAGNQELETAKIEHVITTSASGIAHREERNGINYKFVFLLDTQTQDIFCYNLLDSIISYIDDAIGKEQNVLVHCEAGISRSPSVVAAYLMYRFHISFQKALAMVREKRPIIEPNDGFLEQLKILQEANFIAKYDIVCMTQGYKNWRSKVDTHDEAIMRGKAIATYNCSSAESAKSSDSEDLYGSGPDTCVVYTCRKCGKIVFDRKHVTKHKVSSPLSSLDDDQPTCEFRYLIEPMKWMEMSDYEGKISCPSCGEKLGQYVWGGRKCHGEKGLQCNTAVRPWFHIKKSRVDRKVYCNGSLQCTIRDKIIMPQQPM